MIDLPRLLRFSEIPKPPKPRFRVRYHPKTGRYHYHVGKSRDYIGSSCVIDGFFHKSEALIRNVSRFKLVKHG